MKGIIIKLFKLNLSSSYKSKLIGYDRDEMGHDLIYATPSTLLIFSLSLSLQIKYALNQNHNCCRSDARFNLLLLLSIFVFARADPFI